MPRCRHMSCNPRKRWALMASATVARADRGGAGQLQNDSSPTRFASAQPSGVPPSTSGKNAPTKRCHCGARARCR